MCASCGCGCKHGIAAKGCNCKCKTCREARMSVEKSFAIAKAYRDLNEFAKSVELAPTHVGSISAGQRYCDNGSCATCIRQASRDKNARQTALHVRKSDDKINSTRLALGTVLPGMHGAVAGKKGKKLRAAGNEITGDVVGGAAGIGAAYGVGRALRSGKIKNPKTAAGLAAVGGTLGLAGGVGGATVGTMRAHKKGYYKDIEK